MLAWVKAGYPPDKFPKLQEDKDDYSTFLVLDKDGIRLYEYGPEPIRFEDKQYATGSGRDFALAAMYLGKTAKEAVEIASLFDTDCGNGVDVMTLEIT